MYKRNTEASSCNHRYCGKAESITHSESVSVALGIEHAMSMRSIRLSSVACPALQYISMLSHKRHDFRGKKVSEYIMRVLILSTTFVRNISHSKTNWARYDQRIL